MQKKLLNILKETFGHSSFRFHQLDIIKSVLSQKDTLAIMPTGGGKSLCYQIPALYLGGVCVVISPLISLMQDQVLNLKEYGVKSCFLNSSQSLQEKKDLRKKIRNGEIKILYVSPEAVLTTQFISFLKELELSLIAIDEAHCVSQWGHEFRKDYTRLHELKAVFINTPVLALTATADEQTRKDITKQLQLNDPNIFISSFDRPNIRYIIQDRDDELKQLNNFIKKEHPNDTGIVYCLSRKKVEKIAEDLSDLGHFAVPYHAGLSTQIRKKNQELFNNEEKIIIVATIAFGMGIDRPDVRFVAHLDLPKSVESYYQETGRAGRDGKESTAWMLYGLQDVVKLSQMLESTEATEAYKKIARHKLDCMLFLCETLGCRRHFLLNYFGEQSTDKCENCDSCIEPAESWNATEEAQKVLSTIYRTGQIYGASYIIDVIRGSTNAKIIEKGHDNLSVYGIGKDKSKNLWSSIIRQLLNMGYISVKDWEYRSLVLTEKSKEILTAKTILTLRKMKLVTKTKADKKQKQIKENYLTDDKDLFEALRKLRKELAVQHNVPPYIIFSDKTLQEMCLFKPRNNSEFLMINGVGQTKLENYGGIFLKKIGELS